MEDMTKCIVITNGYMLLRSQMPMACPLLFEFILEIYNFSYFAGFELKNEVTWSTAAWFQGRKALMHVREIEGEREKPHTSRQTRGPFRDFHGADHQMMKRAGSSWC
ncbi:MAG: hypothetical protein NTV99_07575 [Deltaproteobacteria bacterium]|nr:hypothetical protein [Deltaproteobacteria bacterium]